MAQFEVYRDPKGEYRWRLRATNGHAIANGGEGYTTKTAAKEGIAAVQKNAPDAEIVELLNQGLSVTPPSKPQ